MKHPSREEWMSYLYGELESGERADVMAHLKSCEECAARVREWEATRGELDSWQVKISRLKVGHGIALGKWAAVAAAVLLFGVIGFGAGRWSLAASVDVERIRAEIEPQLRDEVREEIAQLFRAELDQGFAASVLAANADAGELLAEYARTVEVKRAAEREEWLAALSELRTERAADYLSLKKELDTVALFTDAGLRRAQRQLVQLATLNATVQPAGAIDQ